MEDIVPDEKNQAEYHSLLGRFYYNEKDYARAEKQFGEWVESIRREKVEEEKDKQELPWPGLPLPTACWLLPGRCRKIMREPWRLRRKPWPGRRSPISGSWRRMRF